MPFYTFRNKETGDTYETSLKISELDSYLEEHPEVVQVLNAPRTVDSYRIGVSKKPEAFKDMMKEMKKHHPHGNIEV